MSHTAIAILVFVVSMVASAVVYPRVLRFAKAHHIVDNPNARKLQRVPVPVMGGLVVSIGILCGVLVLQFFENESLVWAGLSGMILMLMLGIWDDISPLRASFRFLVEVALVWLLISWTGIYIDDFHGLWGIHRLEPWVAYALSIWTGVGVINAVNMIDGVDGYSSGFVMMASGCFALLFMGVWSPVMVCLAVIVTGALLPFFMHNVFGMRSKMFIGDGGTLMLGMLMTLFVFYAMSSKSRCVSLESDGLGLAALSLGIMCIPVFDTLRVAFMRVSRGKSPFKPDRTHLHHLFVDMGFSHLGAAISILLLNGFVVLGWLLSWWLGASITTQMYVVLAIGALLTFGFYKLMRAQQNGGPLDEDGFPMGTRLWHQFCFLGKLSHREKGAVWRFFRSIVE